MSTFRDRSLTCRSCGHSWSEPVLVGMHITRLPEVRAAILDGSFQVVTCERCAVASRVEIETVYTDFERHQFVVVALPVPTDWRAQRADAARVFDAAFLFGPPIAAEMVERMTCRMVFGLRALREKLWIWDHGLSDHAVERMKAEWFAEQGVSGRDEVLRVLTIHAGGHLLCGRFVAPDRVPVGESDAPLGVVTFPNARYQATLGQAARDRQRWPHLAEPWVVDHWVSSG